MEAQVKETGCSIVAQVIAEREASGVHQNSGAQGNAADTAVWLLACCACWLLLLFTAAAAAFLRYRHAGGLENWSVRCQCGTTDDDGERMIVCEGCDLWMHTRCNGVPDEDEELPPFMCQSCLKGFRGVKGVAGAVAKVATVGFNHGLGSGVFGGNMASEGVFGSGGGYPRLGGGPAVPLLGGGLGGGAAAGIVGAGAGKAPPRPLLVKPTTARTAAMAAAAAAATMAGVGGSGGYGDGGGGALPLLSGGKGAGSGRVSDRIAKNIAGKNSVAAGGGGQEGWQGVLGKRRASAPPAVAAGGGTGSGASGQVEGGGAAAAQPKRVSQRRAAAAAGAGAGGQEDEQQQQQEEQPALQQDGEEEQQPTSPVFPGPTVGNARGSRSARRRPAGGGGWPALMGFT